MGSRLIFFFARVGILEYIEDPTLKGKTMLYIILSAITLASIMYAVLCRLETHRYAKQLKYVIWNVEILDEMYSAYYNAAKEHMDPIEFEKLYEKLCSH